MSAPSSSWPAIALLLARRTQVTRAGAAVVYLLVAWLGWRLGLPELYLIGALLAGAAHFVLRVAIEVVALVAETLMPQ